MQTPPLLLLEGWTERTKGYPEISKLLSSGVLVSRYVCDIKIMNCNISLKEKHFSTIVSRYKIKKLKKCCYSWAFIPD